MPKYLTVVNLHRPGYAEHTRTARQSIEAAGGSIEYYLTMGQYDAVVITDFPSDEVGAAAALSVGSLGNARTETLKPFMEEETRQIISSMPGG